MNQQYFSDMSQQYYIIDEYKIDKWGDLGQGCQGAVFKCFKNETHQIVCKIIKIHQLNQGTYEREIDIYNQLKQGEDNIHIVKMYDIKVIEEDGEKMLLQFMELCESDLGKQIKKWSTGTWPEFEEIKDIAGQIIHGYSKLKSCNIIHRDLKPDNILIQQQTYKITDFGLGKVLNTDYAITPLGTPLYKAPEISILNQVYTNKADVFSLGVILYQIVYKNKPPISLSSAQDVIKFQKSLQNQPLHCPPVEGIPQEFLDIIQKMITYSPTNRISWDQLENHEYFSAFFAKKKNNFINTQDYYEYVGAVYLQSQKIQIIITKLPNNLIWESLTINLIQFIILQFQLELELIITQLINNERQISSIRHLSTTNISQDKVKQFLDRNNIKINIDEQYQKIEVLINYNKTLKQLIASQLLDASLDPFFKQFFQKQLKVKSTYEEDLFDYWLLQFQIIYKEFLRPWITGYYQRKIIIMNEMYQIEKFSQILIEHPKTDYINCSSLQIYSKIFIQDQMIGYLTQKGLL